jgi:trimeric autotransporter adhesin
MTKIILIILAVLTITGSSFAQLTGIKNIPGTGGPNDYSSVASAIAALNTQGVGNGGVTFNVAANYKEVFNTPHAGYITTNTSSAAHPVTFQKSGTGANPVITAPTGTGNMDAIFAMAGCDFVTFDGFTLQDLNNYDENTWMEWGFAILKSSGSNGSQNITIKNCIVNLTNYYEASKGIYVNNHTTTTITQLAVSSPAGANSNLKFSRNTINCYSGIFLTGFADPASPYSLYDQNNEIGKDGGDTITNVGGGTTEAYGVYTKYQNNLKVANNKITSTMGGTQPHYGIYLTTALNASYELYGNYVSMQFSGDGASASFYPVLCDMGGNGTNNTVNVYHNTVTGCKFLTADGGANQYTYYMYLNNLGVTTNVHGNVISNDTVGSLGVNAIGRVWYLVCNMATLVPGTLNLDSNSVTGNARIQSATGYGLTNFISATGSGNELNMYNNNITDNVISSSQGANILSATMSATTKNIHDNTVSHITQAEGPVNGIYYATFGTGNGNIYRNNVQNIEGLTEGSNISGIYHAAGNFTNYYNNMVSDLRVLNATTATAFINQLNGITINQGTDVGVYNNSVYLSSPSPVGGNCGSSALFINSNAAVDSRNNILVNISVPSGSGKTAALRILGSGGITNFSMLSNYNDLYAGIPGPANLIFSWYDNSGLAWHDDVTLGAYKTRVYPREAQAVTELPPFVNVAGGPYNIHLKIDQPTQCEAGGSVMSVPVAIATDFDSLPRFPNTGYPVNASFTPNAPDIGADEFGGLPNDITPPSIAYSPLLNINTGAARTLTVTISDGSGVPVSGIGLPVLYWKVNAGSYQAVQAIYIAGNTYNFIFGSGTVLGDVISYYVVAQDNAPYPNVTAYPSIGANGFSYNPPACTTPPGTPSTYSIIAGISGVFHVGTGKDFNTLTAAANLINARVLTGPVTLILDDATYPAETFPVPFNANPGSNAINTLTIRPNTGVSPVISTNVATGVLNLNGIDYFILDGSNNGTSSQNLRIAETSTSIGYSYGILVSNYGGYDPATNVTIKNCTIQCTPVHSSVMGRFPIRFYFTGGGYDNCIINNNYIIGGLDGILLEGVNTAISHNCQITNNIIGSLTDSLSTVTGQIISIEYADNTLISGNDIIGPYTGSLNAGMTGILINTGCTNTKIRRNKIHEIYNDNPNDGWGACGIFYGSDASTVTEITNNLIYEIKGGGSAPGLAETNPYGIIIHSGGNLKILFNTISLTGPYLSSINDASSACIAIGKRVTGNNLEIRNNILRNSMECNGIPNTFGHAYGIILEGEPSVFSLLDNNDYFIDGYQGRIGQKYNQNIGMTEYQTLPEWQAFTGQEANSVTIDPAFVSPSNLVPVSVPLNNQGSYIPVLPIDFAGVLRNNPPDVGAYEFGADPFVKTLSANSVMSNSAIITGSVNPAGNTVSTFFDFGKTVSYGTTIAASPASITANVTTGFQISISGLESSGTYHYRARTVTSAGLISYGADSVFNTLVAPVVPVNTTVTNTYSNDTCFNAQQTITVAGTPNTFVVTATGHVTMIAGLNIIFLPGTHVMPGGYLLGRITTNGQYCGAIPPPLVAVKSGDALGKITSVLSSCNIYPNPTTGAFTLEINGETGEGQSTVEIFSMHGDLIFHESMQRAGKHVLSLQDKPAGLYLVRVITGTMTKTTRILKQ